MTSRLYGSPLLALLAAFSSTLLGFAQETSLAQALSKLETVKRVDGAAVGYAGTPGEFYTISGIIFARGNQEVFTKLISSSSAVKRCMGLYCIALTGGDSAARQIKASLGDTDQVTCFPGGCVGSDISVGEFAFSLLLNRNYLNFQEPDPLIKANEINAICVNALANDRYYHLRILCGSLLSSFLIQDSPNITFAELQAILPNLPREALAKAIGRLAPNPKLQSLLLECARSNQASTLAKMTAWSALTRYSSNDVEEAVRENLPQINLLEADFGETIQRQLKATQRHEAEMEPIRKERTWMGMEAIKDQVILAYSLVNPVTVPDLYRSFRLAIIRKQDVRDTVVSTLIAISREQAKYDHSWSTYSDLPEQLRTIVRDQRSSDHRIIDEKLCKAIEANL